MAFTPPIPCQTGVRLADHVTLGVGGPARWFADAVPADDAARAVAAADAAGVPVLVLGGGSNLLIADAGFDGLVLRLADGGVAEQVEGADVIVTVPGGADWDAFVGWTVAAGFAGLECLSGIPGRVGAAPIQNIGAYGQEVAEAIEAVEIYDRDARERRWLPAAACGFGYRTSRFKREGRAVVLQVAFRLRPGGAPTLRYAELASRVAGQAPDLAATRAAVIAIRRGKSMVLDATDENRRSAGSFFLNPVVPAAALAEVERRLAARGQAPEAMPRWPAEGGVKLSAAWLIEQSGLARGAGEGPVGLSTRHTLALVNRGGATAADVLAFAAFVQDKVRTSFGISLEREPVAAGF
ncbi:MAG: UDP-N-acetylmuramate dehydrogenase [Myxococcales bacterium]|nr:UDP-N-acetylmuramate dehydrogenase [Myxococcales bacterium]